MTASTRRMALRNVAGSMAGLLVALPLFAQDDKKKKEKAKGGALKFEVYKDNEGKFRWRLKSANGQIIATGGQGYTAKADAKHAIEVIQKGAAKAKIEDAE